MWGGWGLDVLENNAMSTRTCLGESDIASNILVIKFNVTICSKTVA